MPRQLLGIVVVIALLVFVVHRAVVDLLNVQGTFHSRAGWGSPDNRRGLTSKTIKGHTSQDNRHAYYVKKRQRAFRPGYNWTKAQEGSFLKETFDRIQTGVPSNREGTLLFVGIFCRREDWISRTLIRQTTISLVPPGVEVKFVVCLQKAAGLDPFLWAEMQQQQDLYLLDCKENMDEGKSFQYFTSVRQDFPDFAYYAKTDTDTYVLFHSIALALDASPRCLFYGGLSNGPINHLPNFISGSFYTLSHDLLLMLEGCGKACENNNGFEDVIMAEHLWTLVGGDIQYGDFGSNHSLYYDRQAKDTQVVPRHVLLHPLKAPEEWWRVHQAMISQVTAKDVELAEQEYFWDGPHTTIRNLCQA